MKFRKRNILIYGLVFLGVFVTLGLSNGYQKDKPCASLKVILQNDLDNNFLDLQTVKNLIRETYGAPLEGAPLGEISVGDIEYDLRKNPYIRNAEAYADVSGNIVVEVELRKPLARVYDNSGNGFYLDQDFYKVPLSRKYSANTLLVRGDFSEAIEPADTITSKQLEELKPLLRYIQMDEFRKAFISEIVVDEFGDITMYPELGSTIIVFGRNERIEEKFTSLEEFYHQVVSKSGWNTYKTVNLDFKGQVVAKKRS